MTITVSNRHAFAVGLLLSICAQACLDEEVPGTETGSPDLYVKALSLSPSTPAQGEPVAVALTIGNQGGAAVQQAARVRWYPGENFAAAGCEWTVGGAGAAIDPGEDLTVRCTYAGYPSWYARLNTKVTLDDTNAVDEGSAAAEANNTYLQTISVSQGGPAGPDLYVQAFSLSPAVPVAGQPVTATVTIGNQGTAAAPRATMLVRWYPGEAYPNHACEWTIDATTSMNPGEAVTLQCTYAGFPSWYPSINTKVVVDATNTATETNEANNTYLRAISVSR
jgi:hypothetical protein